MIGRPDPQGAVCPRCGVVHGLLIDGRLPGHPAPGTNDVACGGSWAHPADVTPPARKATT